MTIYAEILIFARTVSKIEKSLRCCSILRRRVLMFSGLQHSYFRLRV